MSFLHVPASQGTQTQVALRAKLGLSLRPFRGDSNTQRRERQVH